MEFTKDSIIGVAGSGTMGIGISQLAAVNGHKVFLYDIYQDALASAGKEHKKQLSRMAEKRRLTKAAAGEILKNIKYVNSPDQLNECSLIIEAVVEDLEVKHKVFSKLEKAAPAESVLATNTSSFSITSIAAGCSNSTRVIGTHFFNPAPVMPLVEIIPGVSTAGKIIKDVKELMMSWGKVPVAAKDTPGFIVNRVARPFYGEALRILEESAADVPTIDWAMKEFGGFKMGPFELMDLIGNDVNYSVTASVFEAFYFDPRFKPSIIQKRLVEAGYLGKKTGRGFYNYGNDAGKQEPDKDEINGKMIFTRILAMLINEAADAVFMNIASAEDIDKAMTKGTNYPKGLLAWADEMGLDTILNYLTGLYEEFGEDRYRPNPLLKRMVKTGKKFYE